MSRQKYTLETLQNFAEGKGWKCLSEIYTKASVSYEWMCSKEHVFRMRWDTLYRQDSEKDKEWCKICSKPGIENLKEHAKRKGGVCLSEKYTARSDVYRWRCENDHEWDARWGNIVVGGWCPQCPKTKYTLSDLQKHARKKGGKCLSDIYHGYHELHEWECKQGHTWEASWTNVTCGGTWCGACHLEKYTINNLQVVAQQRGGECLSPVYTGARSDYLWRCESGHEWEASWGNVYSGGTWCSMCQKLSIEDAQEIAESRDGECLSELYVNNKSDLMWRCSSGHEWKSTLGSVRQGSWCVICKGRKLELSVAKDIACERGGKCLSDEYVNCDSLLKWRCSKRHRWQATLASVKHSNRWCPECWRLSISLSIDDIREDAQKRGGTLLSHTYINNRQKMLWKCKEGHEWETTTASVRNMGSWCPRCRYKSESACREILEDIFSYIPDALFPKCRPHFLRRGKSCLELDGYNEKMKLAFEYQGLQHYQYVPFFHRHGREEFEKQQKRDKIKRERCAEEGVDLIEIPYIYTFRDPDELRMYITEQILGFEERRVVIIEM